MENKHINLSALLDTTSVKENVVPNVKLDSCHLTNFQGINQAKLNILGMLNTEMIINNTSLTLCLHVVSNDTMYCDCLLGRNFIAGPKVQITFSDQMKVEISKTNDCDNGENDIFLIKCRTQ